MTRKRNAKPASEEAIFDQLLTEEDLILEVQMMIQRELRERGVSQKQLADLLGRGESFVSQMLGLSPRNLTLRTIARVMHALGTKAEIRAAGSSDAVAEATTVDRAPETKLDATGRSLAAMGSDVWGELIPMTSTGRGSRRVRQPSAADHAAVEPEYALAA